MKFPTVTGSNLEGRKFTVPRDLEGELNLIFVPFQRWHQDWVDISVPEAKSLVQAYPRLRYYELPTLPRMNLLYRTSLDLGMKMGIPDRAAGAATITLYLDKEGFRRALDIPDEETIVPLLITRQGDILWQTAGPYAPEKARTLLQAVAHYFRQAESTL